MRTFAVDTLFAVASLAITAGLVSSSARAADIAAPHPVVVGIASPILSAPAAAGDAPAVSRP